MGIARRRFVKIVVQSAVVLALPVLALPVLKLAAPVVPWVEAIRGRFDMIPDKRLSSNDVTKPGPWGG